MEQASVSLTNVQNINQHENHATFHDQPSLNYAECAEWTTVTPHWPIVLKSHSHVLSMLLLHAAQMA